METETPIEQDNRQNRFDQLSIKLQDAVKKLVHSDRHPDGEAGAVENLLNGSWLGHPLHPVMTDMVIGGYTIGWFLDILAELRDNDRLRGSADDAIAVGLWSSVLTILTGLNDWTYAEDRARKLGLLHALTNATGSAIYLAAYLTRKRNRPLRFWLSMAGATVITAGAYIGGMLVYDEGMGVKEKSGPETTSSQHHTLERLHEQSI